MTYFIEVIYTLYLFFSGYFLILANNSGNRYSAISIALAYPLSAGITVMPILFAVMLGIKLHVQFVVAIELIKLFVLFLVWVGKVTRLRERLNFHDSWTMLVLVLGIIGFGSIFDTWITNDSAIFALYSKSILIGTVSAFPQVGVVSYGFFWAALNAAYTSLSAHTFAVSISVAYGVSFSVFLYQTTKILTARHSRGTWVNQKWQKEMFWLFVFSTPMWLIMSIYAHSNLISATYLFFLFVCVSLGRMFGGARGLQLMLVFVFATSFGLARMENGLILSIVLSIMFFKSNQFGSKVRGVISYSILLLMAWYGYVFLASIRYHDVILNPIFAAVILASLIALFILMKVGMRLPYKVRSAFSQKIIIAICAFVLVILFTIAPSHGWLSIKSMTTNLFLFAGKWGVFWWMVAITIFIHTFWNSNFVERRRPELGLVFLIGIVIISVIIALSFFRGSYRVGYGDSGNRLMVMAFPFFVIYLYHSYACINFNQIRSRVIGGGFGRTISKVLPQQLLKLPLIEGWCVFIEKEFFKRRQT
ncbi:MAG: hypothetical protein RL212_1313 [Pseudomonadota bacterium]|jgi:hypothetical protein